MIRIACMVFVGVLTVVLFADPGISQDTKKDEKPPEKKEPDTKKDKKGYLPSGWKKLNLTTDQKTKIYSIQGDFRSKIKVLEEQISALRRQEHSEMVKVLTDKQKAELLKDLLNPDDLKKEKGEKKLDEKK